MRTPTIQTLFRTSLRKFIYHPVVLASLDQGYFGSLARDVRTSKRDQDHGKTIQPRMSMPARNLEGVFGCVRKKFLQLFGALRLPNAVAQQDHAVFHISGLPSVQKMAGRRH